MESEFPSNSHLPPRTSDIPTAGPEKEPVTKVISGEARLRKKSIGKRFLESFSGTSNKSVATWVYEDVIIPSIKKLVYESFMRGLEMKLYGETKHSNIGIGQHMAYTAYNRMSAPIVSPGTMVMRPDPHISSPGNLSQQARQMHDFRDVLIPSRAEALAVLEKLYSLLSHFEVVSVSDFYAACGITPEFTDGAWGWYSLAEADISHTREGWIVDLPAPRPIQ